MSETFHALKGSLGTPSLHVGNYPMFSSERDGTTTLSHAIGFRQDGSVLNLHYKLAGRGGMNQVRRQMRALVRDGEAAELCRDVAEKVADSKLNKHSSITEVAIVRDVYQFEEFFSGELAPAKREELARCTVRR